MRLVFGFSCVDLPSLEDLVIGNVSFYRCSKVTLEHLPRLISFKLGYGSCFSTETLVMRDIPLLDYMLIDITSFKKVKTLHLLGRHERLARFLVDMPEFSSFSLLPSHSDDSGSSFENLNNILVYRMQRLLWFHLGVNEKCIDFLKVRSAVNDLPSMSPLFYQIEDFSCLDLVTTIMTAPNLQTNMNEFSIVKQPLLQNLVIQKNSFAGVSKFSLEDLPMLRYVFIGDYCFNCEIGKGYVMKISNCERLSILYIQNSALHNYERVELSGESLAQLSQ